MARVYVTTRDPITHHIMDRVECDELFGEDYIEDYGIEIPDELLQEYQDALRMFWAAQNKITDILHPKKRG